MIRYVTASKNQDYFGIGHLENGLQFLYQHLLIKNIINSLYFLNLWNIQSYANLYSI